MPSPRLLVGNEDLETTVRTINVLQGPKMFHRIQLQQGGTIEVKLGGRCEEAHEEGPPSLTSTISWNCFARPSDLGHAWALFLTSSISREKNIPPLVNN